MGQTALLKVQPIRNVLGIPEKIDHAPVAGAQPEKDFNLKDFVEGVKDATKAAEANEPVRVNSIRSRAQERLKQHRRRQRQTRKQ